MARTAAARSATRRRLSYVSMAANHRAMSSSSCFRFDWGLTRLPPLATTAPPRHSLRLAPTVLAAAIVPSGRRRMEFQVHQHPDCQLLAEEDGAGVIGAPVDAAEVAPHGDVCSQLVQLAAYGETVRVESSVGHERKAVGRGHHRLRNYVGFVEQGFQ